MRKRIWTTAMALVALSFMAFIARADDEEKISIKNLPSAVKKAIKKKFPKAEIEKAGKEVEDGKTTYEVELEIDDRPVSVVFKADGTILEIEREIPLEKLPAPVKKALAAKYPGAKIEKVEVITKGQDGPPVYEIAIKTEVVLTAKGKFVESKEKEEDEEKPVAKAKKSKKDDDDEEDDDEDDDKDDNRKKGKKDEKGHND
jgi:Putative beta-lactamase-inhibitor-like, PepSY-like